MTSVQTEIRKHSLASGPTTGLKMSAVGGLKKAWRDSAGLMLLTGPFRYNGWHSGAKLASVGSFLGFGSVPPICLEEEVKKQRENMELLFVQRNKITEFMVCTCIVSFQE